MKEMTFFYLANVEFSFLFQTKKYFNKTLSFQNKVHEIFMCRFKVKKRG